MKPTLKAIKLDPNLIQRVNEIARATGRSQSFYVNEGAKRIISDNLQLPSTEELLQRGTKPPGRRESVRMDAGLHQELKDMSASDGRGLYVYVEEGVRKYLEEQGVGLD